MPSWKRRGKVRCKKLSCGRCDNTNWAGDSHEFFILRNLNPHESWEQCLSARSSELFITAKLRLMANMTHNWAIGFLSERNTPLDEIFNSTSRPRHAIKFNDFTADIARGNKFVAAITKGSTLFNVLTQSFHNFKWN